MKTIAVISQKGGAGKTTIALNLAVAALRSGHQSAVIDIDPQASAKCWHDLRQDDAPAVVSAQAVRLPEILQTAKQNGAELVIIDTAPHSESAALAAARLADLVLVPCRPSLLDLKAITTTIDLAVLAKTPALAVLNTVPVRGGLKGDAEQVLRRYGVEMAPVTLGHRVAFVHSLTTGQGVLEYEPDGKATEEITELFRA
ncbi:MAG: AAA family ATPase, partial [Chlorobium limicola]|nr:AAA family ATPase [Chlorobium limicola]